MTRFNQITVGNSFRLAMCLAAIAQTSVSMAQAPPTRKLPGSNPPVDPIQFYVKQAKPLLQTACFSCHSGGNISGGLNLASHDAIVKGGVSGPAVDGKSPELSLIVQAINYKGRQMPPSGKLSAAQIDVLTRWVLLGAPTSASQKTEAPARTVAPPVNAETMKFWSFRPLKRPTVPAADPVARRFVSNPIDAFILAGLKKKHLSPSERASKTALLRRATYDLTGLPPTPAEVKAFLSDKGPNAYAKVVDRLLSSPHYGERWARHWMDLVRYAESNSFERDNPKPFAWRYRDYLIRSFNQDKPYDRFVKEQLAGDELANANDETLIATGYYRMGAWDDEPADPEQARYDELDDIVATTGQVFLGLTVNCARCHDHKIDPIPQKDYYSLLSFFQGTTRYGGGGGSVEQNSLRPIGPESEKRRFEREDAEYRLKLKQTSDRLTQLEAVVKKDLTPVEVEEFRNPNARLQILKKRVRTLLSEAEYAEAEALSKQKKALEDSPPKGLEQALCVTETGKVAPGTFVLIRGNPHVPGDTVQPAFLSILAPPAPVIRDAPSGIATSGRRLALANWIASPDNKLTARVIANRIWQYHFGRGIVRSTSNFGFLGTPPTHPELLDWLATEVIRNGWKLKPIHRLIMLSSAYQMASTANARALKVDPENDLFWRFDMRRLDAEEIRDSLLAVNRTLNLDMGGPPVYPDLPAEVLAGESRPGANWEKSTPEQQARRSVYIHIKRSVAIPILASFDAADTDFTCPVRFVTTQPTQALGMLNSEFTNTQAKIFADNILKSAGSHPVDQVRTVLERCLQRPVSARELDRGVKFISSAMTKQKLIEAEALRYFCVVALNLNEFVYLD